MPFDGETYSRELDGERLLTQLDRVREAMLRWPRWWTLSELQGVAGGSQAGISARVRDLRKKKFGKFRGGHRRREGGLWEYRIVRFVTGPGGQGELFSVGGGHA